MTWRDRWARLQQRMAVEEARKPIELSILKEWLVHHHTVDIREQVPLWDAEQRSSSQLQRSVRLNDSAKRRIELSILKEWLIHHHTVDILEQVPLWDAKPHSPGQPRRRVQMSASGKRRSGV